MIWYKKSLLTLCLAFLGLSLAAQASPYEVGTNNPLRKSLLNVIRKPTEAEMGQKVEFVVSTILSKGNWAFAQGMMQQPGGADLDVEKFKSKYYYDAAKEGLFDNNFQALLQKKGGKWVIVKRALGCTDVCWLEWKDLKGVSADVFPQ